MDCIKDVLGCSGVRNAAAISRGAIGVLAEVAADLSEHCCSRNGMKDSMAGMVAIHEGCPRVIAGSKGK